jgi:hypothetical protein
LDLLDVDLASDYQMKKERHRPVGIFILSEHDLVSIPQWTKFEPLHLLVINGDLLEGCYLHPSGLLVLPDQCTGPLDIDILGESDTLGTFGLQDHCAYLILKDLADKHLINPGHNRMPHVHTTQQGIIIGLQELPLDLRLTADDYWELLIRLRRKT